ncbi:MAG: SDR family oxidoreductase [Nitriliruptorales bacterium]
MRELAAQGWRLVVDARGAGALEHASADLGDQVTAIPGDVADVVHRRSLAHAVGRLGRLDLLVNNASVLGPSPQPTLDRYPLVEIERVYRVNAFAPLAVIQELLPHLTATSGSIVNITSDAAVEPHPGWGGYGSSKAALEQLTAVLGAEQPGLRVYALDPGDLRTQLHQEAFPGEDISDRPEPETVVPAFLALLESGLPSGRYRAADLLAHEEVA